MAYRSYKGKYKPRNPKKYKGDPTQIIYRSGLELRLMNYLDNNPNILEWGSEELYIPYFSPVDQKMHRYFPDFVVRLINKQGKQEVFMVEVKPSTQTRPPKKQKRLTKKFYNEAKTWSINEAKWIAARGYCKTRGWKFQIFTEKELGVL